MKRFCCLTLICLTLVPMPSLADDTSESTNTWVEVQSFSSGLSRVTGKFDGSLTKDFGYYVLIHQASDGYHEIYAGPRWKALPWLEIGVGVGREIMPRSIRRNVYFSINYEKFSAFGTFEDGGSGPWHRVDLIYRLTDKFGVGVMDEAGFGLGPRLEYTIKKDVTLWGALLHDRDTGKTVSTLAVNYSF